MHHSAGESIVRTPVASSVPITVTYSGLGAIVTRSNDVKAKENGCADQQTPVDQYHQIPVEVQVCEIPLWLWLFHLVNAFHLQILFVTRVSHVFFITDFALPRMLVIRPSLPTPLLHSILLIHCLALLFLTYTVTRKG